MQRRPNIASPLAARAAHLTRRQLLGRSSAGIGTAALASLLGPRALASTRGEAPLPHFAPKAKRVSYLFMSGAPSQFETFDWKPRLRDMFDQELPDSIRGGQRITTMTSGQARFPIAPSKFDFARHGECGTEVCETLPWTAKMVDRMCVVRSVHTDAINHDPAITFMQTGSEQPGRPSFGSWLSYGLGSMNRDLPSFVVMTPRWKGRPEAQALYQRLWGAGFLPSEHQGVALRAGADPVLYLQDPAGGDRGRRRRMLDAVAELLLVLGGFERADRLEPQVVPPRAERGDRVEQHLGALPRAEQGDHADDQRSDRPAPAPRAGGLVGQCRHAVHDAPQPVRGVATRERVVGQRDVLALRRAQDQRDLPVIFPIGA